MDVTRRPERRRSSGNSSLSSVDSELDQMERVVWEKGADVMKNSPTRVRRGAKWGADIMTDLNALRRFSEGSCRRSSNDSRRRSSGDSRRRSSGSSLRSSIDSTTSGSDNVFPNSRSNSNVSATSSTASADYVRHGARRSSSNASAGSNASDRHSDHDELYLEMDPSAWYSERELAAHRIMRQSETDQSYPSVSMPNHRHFLYNELPSAVAKFAVDQPVEVKDSTINSQIVCTHVRYFSAVCCARWWIFGITHSLH